MNWTYVHATVNHLPVILAVVGAVVTIAAIISRRRAVWLYAVVTLVLAGLSIYPVQLTGSSASTAVSRFPGVERDALEAHEEAGETTTWVLLGTAAVAAFAWWQLVRRGRDPRHALSPWLQLLVTVGAVASLGMTAWTAKLGGVIIHGQQPLRGAPGLPTGVPTPPPESSLGRPAPVSPAGS